MVAKAKKDQTAGDLRHDLSNSATALLGFVERIERLTEEADGIAEDRKEVYGEAKATGFDTAILRRAITLRKIPKAEREETDALLETYMDTLEKAERAALAQSVAEGA